MRCRATRSRRVPALARALVLAALLAVLVAAPAAAGAASPFALRGVIEGSYGQAWDVATQARMLRWMSAHDLNAYVHAPKSDPYGRYAWRTPYPADQQRALDSNVRLAASLGVQWIPDISPGLALIPSATTGPGAPDAPLCFSCPADLQAVVTKFEPFIAAGSRTVMVSFDDAAKAFADPADTAAYGTGDDAVGTATGDFLTRLQAAERARHPDVRVLTVLADYNGTAGTDYLTGVRSALAPGVSVMWTGDDVPANQFTAADARAYGALIGRRPLVWLNWTDNDSAGNIIGMPARIFLGPFHLSPLVAPAIEGMFLNPDNEADLNKLPLATAAEWLADPTAYQPGPAWERALAGVAGTSTTLRDELRAWADTSYDTKLDRDHPAPAFSRLAGALTDAYAGADWPGPSAALARQLALVAAAPQTLAPLPDHDFFAEAAPFLSAAAAAAGVGEDGNRLLGAERPAVTVAPSAAGFAGHVAPPDPAAAAALRSRVSSERDAVDTSPEMTYGWRGGVGIDVPPFTVAPNAMDAFLDAVNGFDSAWAPSSAAAASSVTLTRDGAPVAVSGVGTFTLPPASCGARLLATDGAGGRTAVAVPSCASAPSRCTSRRVVIVTLPFGTERRGLRVRVNGRPAAAGVRRLGRRLRVSFAGRPAGVVHLRVALRRGGGRPGVLARAYRLCAHRS